MCGEASGRLQQHATYITENARAWQHHPPVVHPMYVSAVHPPMPHALFAGYIAHRTAAVRATWIQPIFDMKAASGGRPTRDLIVLKD
jgi:hypothetical protein